MDGYRRAPSLQKTAPGVARLVRGAAVDPLSGHTGAPRLALDSGLLLRAYAAGLFPMAEERDADDIFWVEPRRRGILPLDAIHLPQSLKKSLKKGRFRHSHDLAFEAVIRCCQAPAPGREQSWINPMILDASIALHREGHAHSIEVWDDAGELLGGLYGIRIGAAFFGESMFSRATDASKAALFHLIVRLRLGGFRLLDTQFLTAHLERFGGSEITRTQYLAMLKKAIAGKGDWLALDRSEGGLQPMAGAGSVAGAGAAAGAEGAAFAPPLLSGEVLAGLSLSGARIVQLFNQTS